METPLKRSITMNAAGAAALGVLVTILGKVPFTGTISGISFIPNSDITGVDVETRSISIINKGSGGIGTTEVAAIDFEDGVDASARVPKPLTLSATAADLDVTAGDVLVASSSDIGETGTADPGGQYVVEITRGS